jgi:hypothetical protein
MNRNTKQLTTTLMLTLLMSIVGTKAFAYDTKIPLAKQELQPSQAYHITGKGVLSYIPISLRK